MKKISIKKKTILRTLVVLILLSMTMFLNGQNLTPTQRLYHDFGTWSINDEQGNTVGIHAYATMEAIIKYPESAYEKQNLAPYEIHRYELHLESKSVYHGRATNTWVYNARVFINDVEMTKEQFPDGFILSIGVEPVMVYWYETRPVDNLSLFISWESAIYETRNL